MSESGPARAHVKGGPGLSVVLPGLPQLLAGRWGLGGIALAGWLCLVAVLLSRWQLVFAAIVGGWDERIAVSSLAAGLAAVWAWSWRDLARVDDGARNGVGQWHLAVRAFSRDRMAVAGLVVVVAIYLIVLLTPLLTPFEALEQGPLEFHLQGMSRAHPLGTDHLSRDVLARVLYGARISLTIGFVAVGISVTLGTFLAGYVGGLVDVVIMRFVDMVISFPRLILLIVIVAAFDPSIFLIIAVLGLTLWPGTARIVRAEVLSLKERGFVLAAEALGYSRTRVLFRHLIPNALGPVIVGATLGIGHTIVLEAGLSFLGLGVQSPTPSWGSMLADGRNFMLDVWWLSMFPGLAIVLTVLSFNLVGDGLRDALDPRLRT